MRGTGKSNHDQSEIESPDRHQSNAETVESSAADDGAVAASGMGTLKDAAASIHESRIRAATPAAIGSDLSLPTATLGNPIFAMAKSLVMKDSVAADPQ